MNGTRKMLLSLCAILLLTFGVFACKSSSNTTGQNTAGLNNSTGSYTGGSQEPNAASNVSAEATGNAQVGGRELTQSQSADNSYSGTGQSLVQSNAQKTTSTTTTTTYSTPTVVQTAPTVVEPNTTTTVVTTPVTTAEVTTPTVTETQTTTTETTAPMTSSTQETTTTTTTPTTETTTTHRRMHKD